MVSDKTERMELSVKRMFRLWAGLWAFAAVWGYSDLLWACAVCFGDPDSSLTQGAKAGILILLGVIGTVLTTIAGVALFWVRRARLLQAHVTE